MLLVQCSASGRVHSFYDRNYPDTIAQRRDSCGDHAEIRSTKYETNMKTKIRMRETGHPPLKPELSSLHTTFGRFGTGFAHPHDN